MKPHAAEQPWYREPWPWLLMGGPAAVIAASFVTLALAVKSDDGLVAEDYYKQGLAINRVLERDRRARELQVAASIRFSGTEIDVRLRGASLPSVLALRIEHPTRAHGDQQIPLISRGEGIYSGKTREAPLEGAQSRRLVIEDARDGWRIVGVLARGQSDARLEAAP